MIFFAGDKVRVYGYLSEPTLGFVTRVGRDGILYVNLAVPSITSSVPLVEVCVHPKQCRRLIAKKRNRWKQYRKVTTKPKRRLWIHTEDLERRTLRTQESGYVLASADDKNINSDHFTEFVEVCRRKAK